MYTCLGQKRCIFGKNSSPYQKYHIFFWVDAIPESFQEKFNSNVFRIRRRIQSLRASQRKRRNSWKSFVTSNKNNNNNFEENCSNFFCVGRAMRDLRKKSIAFVIHPVIFYLHIVRVTIKKTKNFIHSIWNRKPNNAIFQNQYLIFFFSSRDQTYKRVIVKLNYQHCVCVCSVLLHRYIIINSLLPPR
jgi:hypothetical protein